MENETQDINPVDQIVEMQPIKPSIKWGWLRAVLFLIAGTIATFIGAAIGFIIVITITGNDFAMLQSDPAGLIQKIGPFYYGIVSLISFLAMMLMLWIFRAFIDKKSVKSLGFDWAGYGKDLAMGLLWGIILIASGFLILSISGHVRVTGTEFDPLELLRYLFLFTIVAFNEEIMLRGYVLNNFCESMNKYMALVVSSLIFMLMHMSNANFDWLAALNIFLAGLVLGIYYIHKKNLWFPIGMHLTWNFFQGPVFGFEVSGMETHGFIIQEVSGSEIINGGMFGFEGSIIASILIIALTIFLHFKYKTN